MQRAVRPIRFKLEIDFAPADYAFDHSTPFTGKGHQEKVTQKKLWRSDAITDLRNLWNWQRTWGSCNQTRGPRPGKTPSMAVEAFFYGPLTDGTCGEQTPVVGRGRPRDWTRRGCWGSIFVSPGPKGARLAMAEQLHSKNWGYICVIFLCASVDCIATFGRCWGLSSLVISVLFGPGQTTDGTFHRRRGPRTRDGTFNGGRGILLRPTGRDCGRTDFPR